MRDSFIFYKSFAEAAQLLGDKARLKLYDAVVELALSCPKDEAELNQLCAEIETRLKQYRNVFAQFLLIKPQIISNLFKYFNGCKGADFGHLGASYGRLGGRPRKNNENPPNENVNVNVKKEEIPKEKKSIIQNPNLANSEQEKEILCQRAVAWWNTVAEFYGLPGIEEITPPRFSKLSARIKQAGTLKSFERIVENALAGSTFLTGRQEKSTWRADFDFFLQENSFQKAREGSYTDVKEAS